VRVLRSNGWSRRVPLPAGLVTDFTGLRRFVTVTMRNAAGETVVDREATFCPDRDQARHRPDAPDRSPYPTCGASHPFTIGAVWGLQAGWSAPAPMVSWSSGDGPAPPDGAYTATVTIGEPYQRLLGLRADEASTRLNVTLRTVTAPAAQGAAAPITGGQPRPAAHRPAGAAPPPAGPRPDLRPLPAYDIVTSNGYADAPRRRRDALEFSATVWVAGQSSLVVDGFRRSDEAVMDAYQYFYNAQGRQIGFAPVGTMEWDPRDGHTHWHFTDFARYRLLDADLRPAAAGGKEAYCLANTDAIDYTLPRANWRPGNTDLHTSCGARQSMSVRQVLDIGNGDTYGRGLPGQSFDITNLPNGTYHIEITANPDGKLYESDVRNNVALRRVVLGGTAGARTVDVPPHGLIEG
jgi:hypothetical protein